ncbi:MAG: TonB-dependent receptor, partial [Pseudomonadota bacterium]
VPSYNVNQQPISDAATIVRPANLRGLSPDSTLILLNNKRRHRSAVIAFLGGGIADGSQGPDISTIPGIALKQVEVLRDGAAAQYGSDAIAGVINFQLRDDTEGGSVELKWGSTYEGDGDNLQVAANIGLPLTDNGFANFSVQAKNVDPTSRSTQRDDALGLIAAGNTDVRQPAAQIWGAPEIEDDITFFGNLGLDLGDGKEAYAFGNWSERTVEGGFFFRNPTNRGGVFNGPELPDGTDTVLVADITSGTNDDGIACPVLPLNQGGGLLPDPTILAQLAADDNCFAFTELFPGGFTPQFGGDVIDASITGGIKGEFDNGLLFDFSASYGRNEVIYQISNTVNPQLAAQGVNMPTTFNPGTYIQSERNVNADFSFPVDVDAFESPLNVAFGAEYRVEQFEIKAGDPNSYFIDENLAAQGFGIGSNGFPGFQPQDAGVFDRGSLAVYVDLEADITDRFLLGFAVRYEDFQRVGDTTDGKITARFDITDSFALRGAVSTGFRAPTVGQANVRNVSTAFTGGVLADEATLPPTNPISVQLGGVPLTPEESTNFTFGAVFGVANWDVTVDYFNIEVEDRIALTTTIELTPADIAALLAQGETDASSFTGVRFFTNDFDTTTQGIDFVATSSAELFGGNSDFIINFNWTDTEVDAFNPTIIGPTRVRQLEENLPATRGSFTWSHAQGDWRGYVRVNHYGSFFEAHLDDGGLPIEAGSSFTVDAEATYQFTDEISVSLGAQNLLDEYPDDNPFVGIVGATYPVTSPFGFNGGSYYLRANWDFR